MQRLSDRDKDKAGEQTIMREWKDKQKTKRTDDETRVSKHHCQLLSFHWSLSGVGQTHFHVTSSTSLANTATDLEPVAENHLGK